jgi:myo-inositol-1(or 4)-monophosphatase
VPDHITVCEQAARAGGQVLRDWTDRFEVREKGPADLVTEADLASQDAIRQILLKAFPQYGLVGEESEKPWNPNAAMCWVVDPLDGTTNYVHRLPHYAVSIALVHDCAPIVAVVYDPVRDECFTALRGQGAFLNGRPLSTSGVTDVSQALVAASFAARVTRDSTELAQFVAVALQCQAVRRTGSAALNLSYVAAGRMDAFWAMSTKSWDVAAGALLVEEAGGIVRGVDGGEFDLRQPHPVACATAPLHAQFHELLKAAGSPA